MNRELGTNLYILAIGAVAVQLAVLAALLWPIGSNMPSPWLMLLMVLLIALAGRLSIILSRQAEASLFTVPLYMAVLVMHPTLAALVGVVGTLIFQLMLRRPLRAVAFNAGMAGMAGALGGIVYASLRPEGAVLAITQGHIIAAALAGLVLHLHNIIPVVGMITLRKGRRFWLFWAESYLLEATVEGILFSLGLLGALLAMQAVWGLALMILPAFAAYYVLKHTVEVAAKKGMLAEELGYRLAQELRGWQAVSQHSPYQVAAQESLPRSSPQHSTSLRSALR
ncbi:MAG: hypothetical protein L0177_12125 [Chloroflexi bacterium]|nr:hypothetical protein [Chloroflexota bacterium]